MSEKKEISYYLPKSVISPEQVERIFSRTPAEHIKTRPAKGGGQWNYVTGVYVKKVLNYTFGWLWDFEVVDKGNVQENGKMKQIWVQGKLTVKTIDKNGNIIPAIVKTQFGGADVKYTKKGMMDYANDLKSATTDCLKKCASEIGIASDVYGANEFVGIKKTKGKTHYVDFVEKLKTKVEELRAKGESWNKTYIKITGKKYNPKDDPAKTYLEFLKKLNK